MVEQWEEFHAGPKDVESDLHVTLNKHGVILLGARTFDRMGKPDAVVLFFDKMNSKIGLMPSHDRVENAHPLQSKGKHRHRILRASRLCRHYGIKVDRTIEFPYAHINDNGILVLDLKTTNVIGRVSNNGK
ncbi:MAG: hypothetical protein IPL32_01040 [Chloracidobacterium sp.]|nr:hypothetical protein [Chloracidobacterium sp.]